VAKAYLPISNFNYSGGGDANELSITPRINFGIKSAEIDSGTNCSLGSFTRALAKATS